VKRSEINRRIAEAEAFFSSLSFALPPWSARTPSDWIGRGEAESEIRDHMLGWDLTDFGSGDFDRIGLLLFTLRNGSAAKGLELAPELKPGRKPYAEKVMVVGESQETPLHFHWSKMEDIIVRGGGRLAIQLWSSTPDEGLSDESVMLRVDGALREVEAGGKIVLERGESVCLEPGVYHRFHALPGSGKVLAGEVSAVNDDLVDNRFFEPVGRFPAIEEDEEPYRLLVSDYPRYL
jgi:D-lyxose ketol-isomerase